MFRFGSLKTRIIVLTTIPLSALFLAILFGTITTANDAVRSGIKRSLSDAGSVFIQLLSTRNNELMTMAWVTVRDPRFFATFSIPESERGAEFVPTLNGVSLDFLRITEADFLEVFGADGRFLTRVVRDGSADDSIPAGDHQFGNRGLKEVMKGYAVTDFYQAQDHLVMAALVPVYVSQRLEAVVRLGSYLDSEFADEVKRLTGADVAIVHQGTALSSTFAQTEGGPPTAQWIIDEEPQLRLTQGSMTRTESFTMQRGGVDYLSIRLALSGVDHREGFSVYIARELRSELRPILSLERKMVFAGAAAIIATFLAGALLARSITRPVANVVQAASALKRGEYEYPLDVTGSDEVAYMGRAFDEMRRSLKSYVTHLKNIDEVKSNLIALAGHELRTPLTIITGFNALIMDGSLGEVPQKIKETTQHIQEQLANLNSLVQRILDLSSFEQGLLELEIQPTRLGALVERTIAEREVAIKERKLSLVLRLPDEEVIVPIDGRRLQQAILCLLDNAIRFTPDGGTITVTVSATGDRAFVSLADTGVGIPPHELKWIFDKLYEVGNVLNHSSGKHRFGSKGFGLGLALTKVIVERHGGEVLVKSALGHGSEFTISLNTTPTTDGSLAGRSIEPAVV